jgi:hypothetical protein
MSSVEERIAYLEGRLEDHAGTVGAVQQEMPNLSAKITGLDQKVDRQFIWTVGIQVAVLLAVVGALASRWRPTRSNPKSLVPNPSRDTDHDPFYALHAHLFTSRFFGDCGGTLRNIQRVRQASFWKGRWQDVAREGHAGANDLCRSGADARRRARYELYDGEIVAVPTPLPLHQVVVFRIAKTLDAYAERHGGMVFVAPLHIVFSDYDSPEYA